MFVSTKRIVPKVISRQSSDQSLFERCKAVQNGGGGGGGGLSELLSQKWLLGLSATSAQKVDEHFL